MITENSVNLIGKIIEISEEKIYRDKECVRITLKIPRFSENFDEVLVLVEKTLLDDNLSVDSFLEIDGTVRTKDYDEDGKHHVLVFAYADKIKTLTEEEYSSCKQHNTVKLSGAICRETNFRRTNSGRIISDVMLAYNRDVMIKDENDGYKNYHESYYIPCVAWGIGAKKANKLSVGDNLLIQGRFQSRKYRKKDSLPDDFSIAYEVSIISFEKLKDE